MLVGCTMENNNIKSINKIDNLEQEEQEEQKEELIKTKIECPNNFIPVISNLKAGTTDDFCIAKYEMKIKGMDDGDVIYDEEYIAESRASGTPWKNINLIQAKSECQELGKRYDLPSNEEWMTVAYSIESTPSNWNDNKTHFIGTTNSKLNIGHSCRKGIMGIDCRKIAETTENGRGIAYSGEGLAAGNDDNDACFGYVKGDNESEKPICDANTWNLFRRTHKLNNDEIIWDFSGNVWEWVDWYIPLAKDRARIDGDINGDFLEINDPEPTEIMIESSYKSLNKDLKSTKLNQNRLGRYHPTIVNNNAGAAMRGGNYMQGEYNNGIYALGMGYSPNTNHLICEVGFRCVYRP